MSNDNGSNGLLDIIDNIAKAATFVVCAWWACTTVLNIYVNYRLMEQASTELAKRFYKTCMWSCCWGTYGTFLILIMFNDTLLEHWPTLGYRLFKFNEPCVGIIVDIIISYTMAWQMIKHSRTLGENVRAVDGGSVFVESRQVTHHRISTEILTEMAAIKAAGNETDTKPYLRTLQLQEDLDRCNRIWRD